MNTLVSQLHRWDVLGEVRDKRGTTPDIVFHRVIGLRKSREGVCLEVALLNLATPSGVPRARLAEDLESDLQEQHWIKSEHDPCIPKIRDLDAIDARCRGHASACISDRMALVRLVDDAGWDAFIPRLRAGLIRQAAGVTPTIAGTRPAHSPAWVRKLLVRYWRYGGSSFALVPGRLLNGAPSREERIRRATAKNQPCTFSLKTGPKPSCPDARPDLGPSISPEVYSRVRVVLMELLEDKTLQPALARSYDRSRGVPWALLTRKVNERLVPKTIRWDERGCTIAPAQDTRLFTRRQIQHLGKSLFNLGDFVVKVKDWKQVALDHHVPRGDARDMVERPGQRYAVDVAEADVFLVHDKTLLPIGRVYLTFVVDCFSRMIAAVYPWAGEPNVRMVSYGLNAAAMPKSEWGRLIGENFRDEDWPCQGLPEGILCDNGEAATHGSAHLAELAFDVLPNRPYMAYLKQAVETSFRLANVGHIDLIPASTKGPRERGAPDPQKKAQTTLALFTRQINRWACHVANHREIAGFPAQEDLLRERTPCTPFNLWMAGCRLRGGSLRPYVRERHLPALLESKLARIIPQGIDLDGVYFDFPADECPDWFISLKRAATAGPAKRTRVHFDRMTLNRIYLVPKDPAQPIIEIPLSHLSRQWKDYSRSEYDAVRILRREQGHVLKHAHAVRSVAFGQSVDAENTAGAAAITREYGSLRKRNEVSNNLGQDGQVADQMRLDCERDQALMPSPPTKPVPAKPPAAPAAPTYESILNLE